MSGNTRNWLIIWGIILSAVLLWTGTWWWQQPRLPETYSADAVRGKVVDDGTGRPVASAIVIAVWELKAPYGLEGHTIAGHMHVAEVLTNNQGEYLVSGWGPRPRPENTFLEFNAPLIVVFKDGYDFFAAGNWREDRRYSEVQRSDQAGEIIRLKKFEGDLKERSDRIWRATISLESILNPNFGAGKCDWLNLPNFVLLLDKYNKEMATATMPNALIPGIKQLNPNNICGEFEGVVRPEGGPPTVVVDYM